MTLMPRIVFWWTSLALLLACGFTPAASDRGEAEQDSALVLSWSRQGGFAGFCDELKVAASGDLTASSCKESGARSGKLSSDDLRRLNQWLATFGSVAVASKDAATADAMTMKLTLAGKGRAQPSETQRQELLDWAQRIYLERNR
jgi:hypothetical protein